MRAIIEYFYRSGKMNNYVFEFILDLLYMCICVCIQGMEAGGVLVHCFGGRSRSAALIAAFLMSSASPTEALSYADVQRLIYAARPLISINRGFEIQLKAYSQTNFNVYNAQQVRSPPPHPPLLI